MTSKEVEAGATNDEKKPVGEEVERESWGNHCEFFLSSLGLAVGLGNVWRFPYVCYTNGGGSFLLPYTIMLFVVGIPALFLEQSLGQYHQVGANKVFDRFALPFKGVGYAMLSYRFFVNVYYVVITAWALFFLFAGFTSELPWGNCQDGADWHTPDCWTQDLQDMCNTNATQWFNGTCVTNQDYCIAHNFTSFDPKSSSCLRGNDSELMKDLQSASRRSPAEDYWNGFVLGMTIPNSGGEQHWWGNYGTLRWQLVLCLLLAWVLIALSMIKGLASYGKVAYFITLSPYVVLTALLIYTLQLDGAVNGIKYFVTPEWEKLKDITIWSKASSQIFFSLSLGYGSQLALSSYNKFENNTQRDAVLIGIFNSLTSIYAGVVVFSILGFLAGPNGDIGEVVKSGIALAFVSYPSAVLQMSVSPLWSFLFFFMLINLALSSICGGFQTALAFVTDEWPSLEKHRLKLVFGFSIVYFLLGMPMCGDAGILVFTVFDKRCTASLLVTIFLEMVSVSWFYGVDKFIDDLNEMGMTGLGLAKKNGFLRWFWKIMFTLVVPVILAVVIVYGWVDHEKLSYEGKDFPPAVEGFGWAIEVGPLAFVFIFPMVRMLRLKCQGLSWSETWTAMKKPIPAQKDE